MNKFGLLGVVGAAALLAGCGALTSQDTSEKTAPAPAAVEAPQETPVAAVSSYVAYSDAARDAAVADGKDVAVFFHSKSCGSCRKLDAEITETAANIPSDVLILKADYESSQALAAEYGVTKYHTIAYIQDGELTNTKKGVFTLNDLVSGFSEEAAPVAEPQAAAPAPQPTAVEAVEETPVATAVGSYVAYSDAARDAAIADGKKVAVFFHSSSCGSCRALDTAIQSFQQDIPGDVVVLKADFFEESDLAAEYNVTSYHTVAYLDGGQWTLNGKGIFDLETLLSLFDA